MTRRRLIALVSIGVLFTLGLLAVGSVLLVTRTTMGREKLRSIAQPLIASRIHGGTIYIGHVTGSLLTNITVDSLAITDKRGEVLAATGRATFYYNPRDLIDQRIYITRAYVEHPFVHIIQHQNGQWNFQEIFAQPPTTTPTVVPKNIETRGLGDYMVFDSTHARNATFVLTMAWEPDPALKGAARDSAIKYHLTHANKAVTKTYDGYGRNYVWKNANAFVSHVRLADPDSDKKFGSLFQFDSMSVDEYEPTFKFRNVRGALHKLGDTISFEVPHFDMPASTGHGSGRVWWGNDRPVQYNIAVRGDSVSLDDVNWVYPDLPRTGGGSLDLLIRNDPKNAHVLDFHLLNMDVKSTKSHLAGTMTFGIGEPVLLVRSVDLKADPVNFDLLRTLAGKPFPEDWQGDILGTVKGPGGPLTHFVVSDARASFNDAHVRGAVSRFSGRGELDILNPAFTAFHGFDVNAGGIDLRTIEYLFPNFPRLGGIVSGTATLDSSWLDVRFSNAHLMHQDGPGEPSRFSGSGRITDNERDVAYDLALNAEPLSLTMIARSYPNPLRGLVNGPIRVWGTAPDLETVFSLQGSSGALSFDGRLDLDSIGGMGAHGRGEFSNVNPPTLLEKPTIPPGVFSGRYAVDLAGETAATLHGTADLDLERTAFDSVRVYPSSVRLSFGDGKMTILDSLLLRTGAGTLIARGGIGLPKGTRDSLRYSVTLDSLGGLRRYISNPDTSRLGAAATPPDSLSGTLLVRGGRVVGTLDSAQVTGRLSASNLYFNHQRIDTASVDFNVTATKGDMFGGIVGRLDSVTVASVLLDSIGAVVQFSDLKHFTFSTSVQSRNGPTAVAAGRWMSDSNNVRDILLDSLGLSLVSDRWALAAPTRIHMDSTSLRLDSLVLHNRDTAVIALSADIPNSGAASARLAANRVPLKDFGILAQLPDTLTGLGDLAVNVTGTKQQPILSGTAALTSMKWRGVDIDRVTSNAQYAGARLNANLDVIRGGASAVRANASLPIELTLPLTTRWRNDTIGGALFADSTDLSFLQLFLGNTVTQVSGKLSADIKASGTERAPVLSGKAVIANGSAFVRPLNVQLTNIRADSIRVGLDASGRDSISVDSIVATTADRNLPTGHVKIAGWIKDLLRSGGEPVFSLSASADMLHAYNRRSVADVYISTVDPLQLKGSLSGPVLSGSLRVDRGAIYLSDPDLARKQAVQFGFSNDSVFGGVQRPVSPMMQKFMTNLQIAQVPIIIGNDFRLRSKDANVKLGGSLQLETSTDRSTRRLANGELFPVLGLIGALQTEGGTYNLNLGPVQREFQVVPGGTVTFDGPPENPILDIKAQYNVKQVRDLSVVVHLTGRVLPTFHIDLSNTGDYQIATSDLLSYLLIGSPGFDFGANAGTQQILSSVLAPSANAVFSNALRNSLGSWVDVFQLQLPTVTQTNSSFQQYLSGSTVGAEKQFGNVYLNLNTGFCQFTSTSGQPFNPLTGVGAKAEYRFDPKLSLKLAYDPPTADRSCLQQQSLTGLVPTPPNFSFSLSHVWRF